jgi:hypothetical protein
MEIVGNILKNIGLGNNFLNRTPVAQQLRERMIKWDCIKLKTSVQKKKQVTRLKRLPTKWEKIFASYSSIYGTNIQNLQGTQKTKLPKNQQHNEEMGT